MAEKDIEVTYDGTESFFKAIEELVGLQVMVGIPASSPTRRDGPITNAQLGYIHEHGSPIRNIPARPFLEPTIDRLQDKATVILEKAAAFHMDNKPEDVLNSLNALGMLGATEAKKTIIAGLSPGLRPATIRARQRRGNMSEKPLIDTGQLLASITYVIRKT